MPETRAAEKRLKVFISYSRKDFAFAEQVVAALEARGLAPKIAIRDLPTLQEWRRELLSFMKEADAIVFIVSPIHNSKGASARRHAPWDAIRDIHGL
jgi:hypothetical protein